MEKAHQRENIFTWGTHVGFLFSFVSVLLIFFFFFTSRHLHRAEHVVYKDA